MDKSGKDKIIEYNQKVADAVAALKKNIDVTFKGKQVFLDPLNKLCYYYKEVAIVCVLSPNDIVKHVKIHYPPKVKLTKKNVRHLVYSGSIPVGEVVGFREDEYGVCTYIVNIFNPPLGKALKIDFTADGYSTGGHNIRIDKICKPEQVSP